MMKNFLFPNAVASIVAGAALMLLSGCGVSHRNGHDHAHTHGHAPPHGGTPVLVEEDKFHLELVLDASTGKMQAYILDGHLEKYVPVAETSFVLSAVIEGKREELTFQRVPESGATQAAVSSLFEAQADWLKAAKEFQGHIATITLNGATFTNISFPYPKGTKHVH